MNDRNKDLSQQILRLIGSENNRRYLRNLPAFQGDRETPAVLLELLQRLDEVEHRDACLQHGALRRLN